MDFLAGGDFFAGSAFLTALAGGLELTAFFAWLLLLAAGLAAGGGFTAAGRRALDGTGLAAAGLAGAALAGAAFTAAAFVGNAFLATGAELWAWLGGWGGAGAGGLAALAITWTLVCLAGVTT